MKLRIYLDTSVVGGYFDQEFKTSTQLLFEQIAKGEFEVFFSDVNLAELKLAPQHVQDLVKYIPESCKTVIKIDEAVEILAQTYIAEQILGRASENDAYHIALSAVNRVDCLISWNFKHIVNYNKIKRFNSVNLRLGYPMIDIRSPLDFLKDE